MNDGGPAFPIPLLEGERFKGNANGMSLRDYFAAVALSGLCVGLVGKLTAAGESEVSAYAHGACNMVLAERSYAAADAMLRERERTREVEDRG